MAAKLQYSSRSILLWSKLVDLFRRCPTTQQFQSELAQSPSRVLLELELDTSLSENSDNKGSHTLGDYLEKVPEECRQAFISSGYSVTHPRRHIETRETAEVPVASNRRTQAGVGTRSKTMKIVIRSNGVSNQLSARLQEEKINPVRQSDLIKKIVRDDRLTVSREEIFEGQVPRISHFSYRGMIIETRAIAINDTLEVFRADLIQ